MPHRADLALKAAVLAVVATAAVATSAQAADAPRVAAAFGNTVLSIYPDGRYQKIWLQPDGKWEGLGRDGRPLAGRWFMKADKVCLKQSKPPTLPLSYCTAFPEEPQLGVSWASKDFSGAPIKLMVVKGMAEAVQAARR